MWLVLMGGKIDQLVPVSRWTFGTDSVLFIAKSRLAAPHSYHTPLALVIAGLSHQPSLLNLRVIFAFDLYGWSHLAKNPWEFPIKS